MTITDLTKYNPIQDLSFSRLLCTLANWIISIGFILAALMILISGVMFLNSRGDEAKRSAAKRALENAIIGLLLILFAKAIILLFLNSVGVSLLSMSC